MIIILVTCPGSKGVLVALTNPHKFVLNPQLETNQTLTRFILVM